MPAGEPRRGRAVNWRRDPRIITRLPEVEHLHLAGTSNRQIAKRLGVSEMTIRRDLEHIAELWCERAGSEVAAHRARKLAELEDIKRRAIIAAEFDLNAESAILYGEDQDGNSIRIKRDDKGSVQHRGQKANALNVARQAVMDQAKLLGIVVDKVESTVTVRQIVEDLVRDLGIDAESTAGVIAQAEEIVKRMKAPR